MELKDVGLFQDRFGYYLVALDEAFSINEKGDYDRIRLELKEELVKHRNLIGIKKFIKYAVYLGYIDKGDDKHMLFSSNGGDEESDRGLIRSVIEDISKTDVDGFDVLWSTCIEYLNQYMKEKEISKGLSGDKEEKKTEGDVKYVKLIRDIERYIKLTPSNGIRKFYNRLKHDKDFARISVDGQFIASFKFKNYMEYLRNDEIPLIHSNITRGELERQRKLLSILYDLRDFLDDYNHMFHSYNFQGSIELIFRNRDNLRLLNSPSILSDFITTVINRMKYLEFEQGRSMYPILEWIFNKLNISPKYFEFDLLLGNMKDEHGILEGFHRYIDYHK